MEKHRRVKLDRYSNPILTVEEARMALLYGHSIDKVIIDELDEVDRFNSHARRVLGHVASISSPVDQDIDPELYHNNRAKDWRIPESYSALDMQEYLLAKCTTDIERERVQTEYKMFVDRDLVPLLQFLVYIVEYMRQNKLVWGVGRGSSVASYCLYIIGIHKVDSIKYDLPIDEFLKPQ